MSGQIVSIVKEGCRRAFQAHPQRSEFHIWPLLFSNFKSLNYRDLWTHLDEIWLFLYQILHFPDLNTYLYYFLFCGNCFSQNLLNVSISFKNLDKSETIRTKKCFHIHLHLKSNKITFHCRFLVPGNTQKMMMKSGLEKNILKSHSGLQRYLLTCQAKFSPSWQIFLHRAAATLKAIVEFWNNFF